MNYRNIIKRIIPWPTIRKYIIILKQKKVANKLKYLINGCDNNKLERITFLKKKEHLQPEKTIWQYWAQGFDAEKMPPLIQICLDSIKKYAPDYNIIRLSDENISQYIDLPEWIIAKKNVIPIAHYSDLLRCLLLSTYGGLWLDAAVLLTGPLPQYLFSSDFFMYQRDPSEPNKKYWENSFAYYFGWDKGFKVNVLIGIMFAKPNNTVITDMGAMLLNFWKDHNSIPDYFFFQILFDLYIKRHSDRNCCIVNDCIPHLLRQVINNNFPPVKDIQQIYKLTTVHSLNYKNPLAVDELKRIINK